MEAKTLYQWIKDNKDAIMQDKLSGNSNANDIVTFYNLCVVHPDIASLGFLEAAVIAYRKEKRESKED